MNIMEIDLKSRFLFGAPSKNKGRGFELRRNNVLSVAGLLVTG